MIPKDINSISEADLELLINNSVMESRTLEYKSELNIANDSEKKEFLADISSFANAIGGDLIFGIIEDRSSGVPEKVEGVVIENIDEEIRKIEGIIRDGISPKIPSVTTKALTLPNSKVALIIRVQKSWTSPHRVVFKGWDKFFSRNSNSKFSLDVNELRTAFTLSETLINRIRSFREERIARLIANDTPVLFKDAPKIVLHMIPMSAFDPMVRIDIADLISEGQNQSPIYSGGWNYKINFDGYLLYNSIGQTPSYAYTQFYKSGIIEAVNSSLLESPFDGKNKYIPSIAYEKELIASTIKYRQFYQSLNIESPVFVFLTLLGVKGYIMAVDTSRYFTSSTYPIDRDILMAPEIIIDSNTTDTEKTLKPVFDAIWNACGWQQSLNYDKDGNWIAKS